MDKNMGNKGDFKGRSDYKGKAGSFESCTTGGDKGIPPGIAAAEGQKMEKQVVTNYGGDKGIPPAGGPKQSQAPLD